MRHYGDTSAPAEPGSKGSTVRRFAYPQRTLWRFRRFLFRAALGVAAGLSILPITTAVTIAPTSQAGALFQLDGAARARAANEPDSLGLREMRVRGRTVWAEPGVSPAQVQWVVLGGEAATSLLPTVAGLPVPEEPVAIYLFADGESFRRVTSALTGLPPEAIYAFEGGR